MTLEILYVSLIASQRDTSVTPNFCKQTSSRQTLYFDIQQIMVHNFKAY